MDRSPFYHIHILVSFLTLFMLMCNYLEFLPIYFFPRVFLSNNNYGNNKLFHIRAVPFMGLGSCLHLHLLFLLFTY